MENQNSTDSFQVNLDQFNGPLDLLLDLAKSQKVNLENISITLLADQFLEYINKVKDNKVWISLGTRSKFLIKFSCRSESHLYNIITAYFSTFGLSHQ